MHSLVDTPSDIAEAIVAVATNRYITGQILVIDGGFLQTSAAQQRQRLMAARRHWHPARRD